MCPNSSIDADQVEARAGALRQGAWPRRRSRSASSKPRPRACMARRPRRSASCSKRICRCSRARRVLRGVENRIARDRINAEAAVQAEISAVAQEFAALDDAYLAARAEDVREVGDRLIRNLTKTPFAAFSHLPEGTIIVAEDLTPADTALMDPAHDRRLRHLPRRRGEPHRHHGALARPAGGARRRRPDGRDQERRSADHRRRRGPRRRPPLGGDAGRIPPPPGRPSSAICARCRGCAACRRSPATAPRSRSMPISSCRASSTWRWRPGPRASACCAPSSCS